MIAPAFRASYSDWKLVRTRQVVQVVFEVSLADADAAYEVLGGMPDSSKERWFGIAALRDNSQQPAKELSAPEPHSGRTSWRDLTPTTQAAIRANDPIFRSFLEEMFPNEWNRDSPTDAIIKAICGINSKTELSLRREPAIIWKKLDEKFMAWKLADA